VLNALCLRSAVECDRDEYRHVDDGIVDPTNEKASLPHLTV